MVIAVVLGVGDGPEPRVDLVIRPFLDAFQMIPPFVYLVPALALFGAGRFTAIMAAVGVRRPDRDQAGRRRHPRRLADHRRGGPRPPAARRWQMITKVQLPMAREALVLATNQGLLYVLSMVVIGGLVGGGSLGYIVVSGFSPGPAVRQGPRGRHRDRRARRDARPDRTLRGGPLWPLTHIDFLRGRTAELMEGTRAMGRGLRRIRLVALAAVRGPRPGRLRRRRHQERRHRPGGADCGDLRIAVNPWTGYVANAHVIGVRRQERARLQRRPTPT